MRYMSPYRSLFALTCVLGASTLAPAAKSNPVDIISLSELAIYPQRSAPATVVSLNDTDISTEIAAQIVELPVRVGDVIDAGAMIARLDCKDFESNRDEAQAQLEALDARITLAKKRVNRTERLTRKQTVSEEIFDEHKSELAVLRANWRAATSRLNRSKRNVRRCSVTSPFRALVTERDGSVGQYAQVGTAIVHILDMEALEVSAQVFSDDVEALQRVDAIRFENSGHHYEAKIRTVLTSVNTRTRNREVRLDFVDNRALPGAAGKILWRDPHPHLPGKYIVRRTDALGVFIEEDGKARFVRLPDAEAGRASPIDAGLDTRIITEGYLDLRDGESVTTGRDTIP